MEAPDTGTEKPKRARGRKDASKQEGVTVPQKVKDAIDELVTLYHRQHDAADAFSSAVKTTAEKSNYNAAALRKFVVARSGEKFQEAKKLAEQQMELFDEVGE